MNSIVDVARIEPFERTSSEFLSCDDHEGNTTNTNNNWKCITINALCVLILCVNLPKTETELICTIFSLFLCVLNSGVAQQVGHVYSIQATPDANQNREHVNVNIFLFISNYSARNLFSIMFYFRVHWFWRICGFVFAAGVLWFPSIRMTEKKNIPKTFKTSNRKNKLTDVLVTSVICMHRPTAHARVHDIVSDGSWCGAFSDSFSIELINLWSHFKFTECSRCGQMFQMFHFRLCFPCKRTFMLLLWCQAVVSTHNNNEFMNFLEFFFCFIFIDWGQFCFNRNRKATSTAAAIRDPSPNERNYSHQLNIWCNCTCVSFAICAN